MASADDDHTPAVPGKDDGEPPTSGTAAVLDAFERLVRETRDDAMRVLTRCDAQLVLIQAVRDGLRDAMRQRATEKRPREKPATFGAARHTS